MSTLATGTPTSAPTATDEKLMAAVQADQEGAFAVLWTRHQPLLRQWLQSKMDGDPLGEADDLAQRTWMSVHQYAATYDPERGSFRTWLYTIAARLLHTHRKGESPEVQVEDLRERAEDLHAESPEGEVTRQSTRTYVQEQVAKLRPAHRDAVVQVHLQGMTFREAADRLGTSKSAVDRRLKGGLETLRQRLDPRVL